MGANAQTAVPAFTAGQVLTAAQQTQINTGIPVFATTVTRDAAFGGTGEKTLAEGQFAYIEATNTTQYYDGAAWQTVGQTPGLQYITGAAFSSVASVSFAANTFSSTYRNYKILCDITSASAVVTLTGRLRAGGSDNTTSNYFYGGYNYSFNTTALNVNATSATTWDLGRIENGQANLGGFVMELLDPQVAQKTQAYGNLMYQTGSPFYWGTINMGWAFNATTQFDSFSIISTGGNITGNYRVYGYSES